MLFRSNLTGLKSRIRLTDLVTLVDEYSLASVQMKHGADLKNMLDQNPLIEAQWIRQLYPGIDTLDEAQLQSEYHITEIDMESLGRFILWLGDKACHFSKHRKEIIFRQAVLIYRVALFSKGLFLQRP